MSNVEIIFNLSASSSEQAAELVSEDPISSAVSGGRVCRYCLEKCPEGLWVQYNLYMEIQLEMSRNAKKKLQKLKSSLTSLDCRLINISDSIKILYATELLYATTCHFTLYNILVIPCWTGVFRPSWVRELAVSCLAVEYRSLARSWYRTSRSLRQRWLTWGW